MNPSGRRSFPRIIARTGRVVPMIGNVSEGRIPGGVLRAGLLRSRGTAGWTPDVGPRVPGPFVSALPGPPRIPRLSRHSPLWFEESRPAWGVGRPPGRSRTGERSSRMRVRSRWVLGFCGLAMTVPAASTASAQVGQPYAPMPAGVTASAGGAPVINLQQTSDPMPIRPRGHVGGHADGRRPCRWAAVPCRRPWEPPPRPWLPRPGRPISIMASSGVAIASSASAPTPRPSTGLTSPLPRAIRERRGWSPVRRSSPALSW